MTEQHPTPHLLEPTDEQVAQWQMDAWQARIETMGADVPAILLEVAQWGADQELEACCEWINSFQNKFVHAHDLCLVRRPKPPSLKEQALALINHDPANQPFLSDKGIDTIRRALEQLDD